MFNDVPRWLSMGACDCPATLPSGLPGVAAAATDGVAAATTDGIDTAGMGGALTVRSGFT